MRNKAFRRSQQERMKRRARRIARMADGSLPDVEQNWIRRSDHLASCSCWMCGNPRRYFGERTIQEQKAAAELRRATDHQSET